MRKGRSKEGEGRVKGEEVGNKEKGRREYRRGSIGKVVKEVGTAEVESRERGQGA